MAAVPLTVERLRELLDYDPETGVFIWHVGRQCVRAGATAGGLERQGYWCIRADGKTYKAHRLAWLYMTGQWPVLDIDHINMDRADNRWGNLRVATRSQNKANGTGYRGATARKGAYWQKGRTGTKNWMAVIRKDGKLVHLGRFYSEQEAHAAYCRAADSLFGEYARFA